MKTQSKYRSQATVVDNIRFHSKREASRYCELKLLEKAGEIHNLKLQHRITLLAPAANAPKSHPLQKIGEYVADFVYCTCSTPQACEGKAGVVEDSKGFRTALYKWKKRHTEIQYGIQIREV